jgi:hypothetical protein
MNQHIEQAIDNLRRSAVKYSKTERYYRGEHDLTFATEKFENAFGTLFREFAMNLCPAICDAVRDKLRIRGFGMNRSVSPAVAGGLTHPDGPNGRLKPSATADGSDQIIDHIWFRNRMALRAGEIHKEALKNGDAYAIVWPNERAEVTIYPHRAASVTVHYNEDSPGEIAWAAKYWRTEDKRTRLNIFYPDRIERYITKRESDGVIPDAKEFVSNVLSSRFSGSEKEPPKGGTQNSIPNPFGTVPVFHFANNADVGCLGQSELTQAIPIQDGLNKSILDMLVAMEFSAYRQRWAAGIEVEYDDAGKPKQPFNSGADRLWIATDPNTKFGDFSTSNLDQFIKVKDSFRIDMASVSGTPLHYFLQTAKGFASGESLKQNETRFLAKIRDRQAAFGQTWAELMSFALRLAGHQHVELVTHWEDPAPTDENVLLENLLLKKQLGVSTEQTLREAGYGEIDVRRMAKS